MRAEYRSAMQAFVNEKAAPELLDYKGDLVARLQDQIQNQACFRAPLCQHHHSSYTHCMPYVKWSMRTLLSSFHTLIDAPISDCPGWHSRGAAP